jgi:hypothetical protein
MAYPQQPDCVEPDQPDYEYQAAQKRIKKIKAFYKDLSSWAGTSIMLIGLNLFLSGNITWAKYPVIIWGIIIAAEVFTILRLQYMDKEWEERQMRRFTGRTRNTAPARTSRESPTSPTIDYSDDLLREEERELADLSQYRKAGKAWKDEDLV